MGPTNSVVIDGSMDTEDVSTAAAFNHSQTIIKSKTMNEEIMKQDEKDAVLIFNNTNVHVKSMPMPDSDFWDIISPPFSSSSSSKDKSTRTGGNVHENGLDFSVKFTNAHQGVVDLVKTCLQTVQFRKQSSSSDKQHGHHHHHHHHHHSHDHSNNDCSKGCCELKEPFSKLDLEEYDGQSLEGYSNVIDYLTSVVTYYQGVIISHLEYLNKMKAMEDNSKFSTKEGNDSNQDKQLIFKMRLASTCGSAGKRCPKWHCDYVACRGILSLRGPGCFYVPYEHEVMGRHMLQLIEKKQVEKNVLQNGVTTVNDDKDMKLHDDETTSTIVSSSSSSVSAASDDMETQQEDVNSNPIVNRHLLLNPVFVDDIEVANEMVIPNQKQLIENDIVVQGQKEELIFLLGHIWSDWAVPHRSPDIGNQTNRILLTLDVIGYDDEDINLGK